MRLDGMGARSFYLGVAFVYAADNAWTTLLLWQVLRLTHSSTWLAVAAVSYTVPAILVGITGPEWGLRGRISSWLAATALGIVVLAPWWAHSPWLLVSLSAAMGWTNARVIPMAQAWLMAMTNHGDAPMASSRFEMASRIGMVVGPLMAGTLITGSGVMGSGLANGLLFMVAAWLWRGVLASAPGSSKRRVEPRSAAWRAVRQDRFLVIALSVRAGANYLWPVFTLAIPLLVKHPWHTSAVSYGAVRTLWSVSTVVGTWLIIPKLIKHLKIAYFLSWVVTGLAFWQIGTSAHLFEALLWVMIGAFPSAVVHVALDSHIGTGVATALQSGVFAIERLVMATVNILGLWFASDMIRHVNPGPALSVSGMAMATIGLGGLALSMIYQMTKTDVVFADDDEHA